MHDRIVLPKFAGIPVLPVPLRSAQEFAMLPCVPADGWIRSQFLLAVNIHEHDDFLFPDDLDDMVVDYLKPLGVQVDDVEVQPAGVSSDELLFSVHATWRGGACTAPCAPPVTPAERETPQRGRRRITIVTRTPTRPKA